MHLKTEIAQESAREAWSNHRTLAGFYDGRANAPLAPRSDGEFYDGATKLVRLGSFTMMSHFLGDLSFVANDRVVTFDLSFDNDRAASPIPEVVTASALAK